MLVSQVIQLDTNQSNLPSEEVVHSVDGLLRDFAQHFRRHVETARLAVDASFRLF